MHPAQICDMRGAARAAFEADDAFMGRHMVETSALEAIFDFHQLFGQIMGLPVHRWGEMDDFTSVVNGLSGDRRLWRIAAQYFGRDRKASAGAQVQGGNAVGGGVVDTAALPSLKA